jgi:hypothetical protein
MVPALKKRAFLLACLPALLGLVFGSAPGVAAAAVTEATPLTPELATLAEPAVAAAPEAAQAEAVALPAEGPGSLVREGGDLIVEAHFEGGAVAQAGALEAAGATVLEASARYQTVALSVAPEDLAALAEVPGLEAVAPSLQPVFYGAEEEAEGEAGAGPTTSAVTSNGLCEGGAVTSQAMTQLHVAAARGAFGARGAGQTIGVLSDTFDTATEAIGGGAVATHAAEDEVGNDLPGSSNTCSGQQVPVRVVAEGPADGTDEGRAMLQVLHDLAPHAELAFATAYSTELEFAHNIELLAAPVSLGGGGADVIVDDVGYFAEPFFQDGPVAVAIKHVTEAGVTYLTAAGNDNLFQGSNEFASWERKEFVDATCPATVAAIVGEASSRCMNFSPSGTDTTFGITVEPQSTLQVDLQWAEPWNGVEADLDAYLLNGSGAIVTSSTTLNGPGGLNQPYALLQWANSSSSGAEVRLVIDRCIGNCNSSAKTAAKPRLKFILMEDGAGVSGTEYPKSESAGITVGPTIYGHAGSAAAITLAAANYTQSATAPAEPERYSSRGPVAHYFAPVTGAVTAAAKLASPEVLQKPNATATDCASTTFFASLRFDGWHFCGTSEAAPHAAAIAALMRQTQPAATPSSILAALQSSATPFTKVNSPVAVGAGLLNAEAAIAAIGGTVVEDPASAVIGAAEPTPSPVGETWAAPPAGPTESTTTTTTTKPTNKSSSGSSTGNGKPKVRIAAHPKALERTRRSTVVGRFRFSSNQNGVAFYCRVDGSALRRCGARFRHRFGVGRHVVNVRAVDSSDSFTSAPVAFRFRVQRMGR